MIGGARDRSSNLMLRGSCVRSGRFDAIMHSARRAALSRRQFSGMSVGAGLSSLLSPVANAAQVSRADVDIYTADGACDAYFVHPSHGTHPAVLIWPDIFGLRPTFRQVAALLMMCFVAYAGWLDPEIGRPSPLTTLGLIVASALYYRLVIIRRGAWVLRGPILER
jgi:hypothetical protein